ncbi:hypothetical protein [Desulfovibrio inopinatus]|uniref:hypothetical protein n=1 Tax=Desulfovibrio inopinatus TaxID=102109 RepID=UPI0004048A13|nr:hypothetical protein [Desulfovibrio inopinatus]
MQDNDPRFRKIGDMMEKLGLGITHAHEDMLFIMHNHFLFQLGDDIDGPAIAYLNIENTPEENDAFLAALADEAEKVELKMENGGLYRIKEAGKGNNLELEFNPSK